MDHSDKLWTGYVLEAKLDTIAMDTTLHRHETDSRCPHICPALSLTDASSSTAFWFDFFRTGVVEKMNTRAHSSGNYLCIQAKNINKYIDILHSIKFILSVA